MPRALSPSRVAVPAALSFGGSALAALLLSGCLQDPPPSSAPDATVPTPGRIKVTDAFGAVRDYAYVPDGEGNALVEGDIAIPLPKPETGAASSGNPALAARTSGAGASYVGIRWPSGKIPYRISPSFGAAARERILDAMRAWQVGTPVDFVARTDEVPYVYVVSSTLCYSPVGRNPDAEDSGGDPIVKVRMTSGAPSTCAVHELGHVIGLEHEHTRPDRADHIDVHPENIQPSRREWFDVQKHMLSYTPYDIHSAMHYGSFDYCREFEDGDCVGKVMTAESGATLFRSEEPSAKDRQAVMRMYDHLGSRTEIRDLAGAGSNGALAIIPYLNGGGSMDVRRLWVLLRDRTLRVYGFGEDGAIGGLVDTYDVGSGGWGAPRYFATSEGAFLLLHNGLDGEVRVYAMRSDGTIGSVIRTKDVHMYATFTDIYRLEGKSRLLVCGRETTTDRVDICKTYPIRESGWVESEYEHIVNFDHGSNYHLAVLGTKAAVFARDEGIFRRRSLGADGSFGSESAMDAPSNLTWIGGFNKDNRAYLAGYDWYGGAHMIWDLDENLQLSWVRSLESRGAEWGDVDYGMVGSRAYAIFQKPGRIQVVEY